MGRIGRSGSRSGHTVLFPKLSRRREYVRSARDAYLRTHWPENSRHLFRSTSSLTLSAASRNDTTWPPAPHSKFAHEDSESQRACARVLPMYRATPDWDRFLGYPRYVNTSLSVALYLFLVASHLPGNARPRARGRERDEGARARVRAVKENVSRDAISSCFFFLFHTLNRTYDRRSRVGAPSKSADPGWARFGPGSPRVVTLSPPKVVVVSSSSASSLPPSSSRS